MMGAETTKFPALPVNHDAFKEVDTQEKAYVIGFLLADGCVLEACPGRYRARVNLKIKAGDIQACRMAQEIAGGNLRLIEDGYRVIWEVNSDAIVADLVALGITPRKSLTASLEWSRIPEHLHGAVLAGLIDGDGHMRFKETKSQRRVEVSLCTASPTLRDQLLERFGFFKPVEVPPKGKRRNTLYRLQVENHHQRLRSLILTTFIPLRFPILGRKQAVLEKIIDFLDHQDAYSDRLARVPNLKRAGLTVTEIAEICGTSLRPVLARLKAAGMTFEPLYTPADLEQMKQLHEEGRTVREIHAAIGKGTEQAVRHRLLRLGCITKKTRQLAEHPRSPDILRLHHEGATALQTGSSLGISHKVVCRVLRDAGIALRGGSPLKLTPELINWAESELGKGRTLKAVANEIGVSSTLVRLRLREKKEQSKLQ
jgi:hypothetical protein